MNHVNTKDEVIEAFRVFDKDGNTHFNTFQYISNINQFM